MMPYSSQVPDRVSSREALAVIDCGSPNVYHGSLVRRGQSWFCTAGPPSDITVVVDDMLFHIHKFPLIARSGKLSKLVAEAASSDDEAHNHVASTSQNLPEGKCHIYLVAMPGGVNTFELVAKFCYGVTVEFTATNVAGLRCAAEYLQMTEEFGEDNLLSLAENFLNNVIVRSWKHSIRTLKSCELLLPLAEDLSLVKKCVDSIAAKVCTEPSLYGWPSMDQNRTLRSPSGKLLWSDSRMKGRGKDKRVDWWYEDVSLLNLPLFKCTLQSMEDKGLTPEAIAGALMYYAMKFIPGMRRGRRRSRGNGCLAVAHSISYSNAEQLYCLETIESLLPTEKGLVPTIFLSSLLKVAMILNAEKSCLENLEKRIGSQLETATIDDILIPNYSKCSVENLYDVDCMERIVQHFVDTTKAVVLHVRACESDFSNLSSSFPIVAVAKLVDAYMVEIASDVNLSPKKFQAVLESLPRDARTLDDGMYQAVDIYLKAHPWVQESEKNMLCGLISCEKLTQAACTHAAQNTRLPLQVVTQVLFLEQAQLRAAFTGALATATARSSAAESQLALDGPSSDVLPHEDHVPLSWSLGSEDNSMRPQTSQIGLRADLTALRHRIGKLESKCNEIRKHLQPKRGGWSSLSRLGCQSPPSTQLPVSSTHLGGQRTSFHSPIENSLSR